MGKSQGDWNRQATRDRTGAKAAHYKPRVGTCFVHTVIDDYSRVAYAEIHDDEKAVTAAAVLCRAVAWFAERGVTVERVLRQRGGLQVVAVARHMRRPRHHDEEDPPASTTDQRQDRETPPDPRRRLGLQEALQHRRRPARSPGRLAPPVQPPSAPLSPRWPATHQPVEQPGWASQLAAGWTMPGSFARKAWMAHRPGGDCEGCCASDGPRCTLPIACCPAIPTPMDPGANAHAAHVGLPTAT